MDFFKQNLDNRLDRCEENKHDIQNSRDLRRVKENDNHFLVKI